MDFVKRDECDVQVPGGTGMCGRGFKECGGRKDCKYFLEPKSVRVAQERAGQIEDLKRQRMALDKKIAALEEPVAVEPPVKDGVAYVPPEPIPVPVKRGRPGKR